MQKLNIQQIPKERGYLECLIARPGYKIVQTDVAALEPNVTTYYSRDPNLLNIYGPDAKKNDWYLYNCSLMGSLGKEIRECGYDPYNPTPEAIKLAKKTCKTQRAIGKKFTLSANYGAGPKKIHADLKMAGIDISLHDCRKHHREFWRLYRGIKTFESYLLEQYQLNDGYILNGYGRPLAIDYQKTKDIVNRFVQSTGHDILWMYVNILYKLLQAAKITWMPWIIDFHDETMVEVPEDQVPATVACFEAAYVELREYLQWDIIIQGDVEVVDTLADIKIED